MPAGHTGGFLRAREPVFPFPGTPGGIFVPGKAWGERVANKK